VGARLNHAEVTVDQGGVRSRRGRSVSYTPFVAITDVSVRQPFFGRPKLALHCVDGNVKHLVVGDASLQEIVTAVLGRLGQKRSAPGLPPALAPLACNGRSLDTWLAQVRRIGTPIGSSTYRDVSCDPATLVDAFLDEKMDVDVRAACAYLLASSDDPECRRVVEQNLGSTSPPLVIVAGTVGGARIDDELAIEAPRFLEPEDASALRRTLRGA
jgi:hypothetical protein